MRHAPVALAGVLTLVLAAPALGLGPGHRLGHEAIPTFQAVRLRLDADSARYQGSVRIEVRVDAPADSFQLHARELDLRRLGLRGPRGPVTVTYTVDEHDVLTVRARSRLPAGRYALEIDFTNDFDTRANALYRLDVDGRGYAFTQFQSKAAREAFPCFDEPEFKVPWQLTLVVPERHVAVSNSPVARDSAQGAWHAVVFERTSPLPSYLVAIATGPLETVPIPGLSVPGRVITVKGRSGLAGEAVRWTPKILAALERYFGTRYPYRKLDLLAVPEFWAGAMENAAAVTFREERLLLDPSAITPEQRTRLVTVTAHELAHMWFGDLVTMEWWDDLWLNESFASWMGDKISHEVAPELEIPATQAVDVQGPMRRDAQPSTHAIRQPIDAYGGMDEAFDAIVYDKGQAVLGMLEQWIGPAAFKKGVRRYLAAHEHGSATGDDLWRALSEASGRDVRGPARSFIDQGGVPLVEVEPLGQGRVRIAQRRLLNAGVAESTATRWQIPMTLRWAARDGAPRSRALLLADSATTVDLGAEPAWLWPNAEARGYFRSRLPAAWMRTLADSASRLLDARERIALAGDLPALVVAGRLAGDEALRRLASFARDPEPRVVTTVMEGLSGLRPALVPLPLSESWAVYVRRSLGPALERFGTEARPGEPAPVTILRPQLVERLGNEGRDAAMRTRARAQVDAYLRDPASLEPSMVETALKLAAIQGDSTLWAVYRERFEKAKLPIDRARFLIGLMSFRDPALVRRNLVYALSGALRPQEGRSVFFAIGSVPEHEGVIYEWIKRDWDRVTAPLPDWVKSFLVYSAGGCSRERLEDARVFFMAPGHRVAGTERALAHVGDLVGDCLTLREREGPAVARYLEELEAAK